jgi:ankyrin repeat protein
LINKTDKLLNDCESSMKQGSVRRRRSCLHFAAKYGQVTILRFILTEMYKKSLSFDIQDADGNTAAHLASKYNNLQCLQVNSNNILLTSKESNLIIIEF